MLFDCEPRRGVAAEEACQSERRPQNRQLGLLAGLKKQFPLGHFEKPVWTPEARRGSVQNDTLDSNPAISREWLEGLPIFPVHIEDDERGAAPMMLPRLLKKGLEHGRDRAGLTTAGFPQDRDVTAEKFVEADLHLVVLEDHRL